MAFTHGRLGYFNLDTVGGTPTDLSAYCDKIGLPSSIDAADTTSFGATAKTYIAGLQDGTISVGGKWDPTLDAHMTGIQAAHPASLTFVVGPQGSTAGQRKFTGEAILTDYGPDIPVDGVNTWSATLQCSGAITRTTF